MSTVQAPKAPTTISTTIPALEIQAQAIAPAIDIPASPDISMPSIVMPAATLTTPQTPSLKKTRITVPDYEERYMKLLAAQAEAKRKKKKSLIDSILDEIVRYGFLIVLGLVVLVVFYALRKDRETPGTGFQMPQHPEKSLKDEPEGPKKDIWHDEF